MGKLRIPHTKAHFELVLETDDGDTWLEYAFDYMDDNWSSTGVASIILVLFIVLTVWWITKSEGEESKKKDDSDE